jgi:tyrosyl-tRNA synthetase
MSTEEKLNLIKQVGEEIVTEEELKKLLESDEQLIAYDGFEPSGQMHIAQGILRSANINKMVKAGVKFKMLVADWHAMANNKMGGDLEKIQTVGRYFIEVWKASGMDLSKVEFVWASDLVKDSNYWKLVVQVGRSNALRRFIRTAEIMGREESLDNLTGAMIIYSCMQVADIFTLGAKITQLGMDQRKVNMLAREIGPQLGFWKPVVVSHHMLMGLQQNIKYQKSKIKKTDQNSKMDKNNLPGLTQLRKIRTWQVNEEEKEDEKAKRIMELKMSKSQPDSAIFMTDSFEDIKRKINKAYCPEGIVDENPILEYCRYILFEKFGTIPIERPHKFGGTIIIKSYTELEKLFSQKMLHPQDLKNSVIPLLDKLLQPVRQHFAEDQNARVLLEKVQSYQVTR